MQWETRTWLGRRSCVSWPRARLSLTSHKQVVTVSSHLSAAFCLMHCCCRTYKMDVFFNYYNVPIVPSVLWCCWLGGRKGIWPVKNWVVACCRGYLPGARMQTCLRPSWCHCHSLSLASVKFRLVLPFWYWLTWVLSKYTHTSLTALFPGIPRWASTRKVKPIWILLKQRQWVAVASAGPYASLHLAPGR